MAQLGDRGGARGRSIVQWRNFFYVQLVLPLMRFGLSLFLTLDDKNLSFRGRLQRLSGLLRDENDRECVVGGLGGLGCSRMLCVKSDFTRRRTHIVVLTFFHTDVLFNVGALQTLLSCWLSVFVFAQKVDEDKNEKFFDQVKWHDSALIYTRVHRVYSNSIWWRKMSLLAFALHLHAPS